MPRHLPIRLLLAAMILCAVPHAVPLWPDAPPPTDAGTPQVVTSPPEAPTTILSTQLGGADVRLDLLGSWTATASFGTGLLLLPGVAPQPLDAFPQLDQGFIFNQTPDLTISLELLKRFFVDANVVGDLGSDAIHLGYQGAPGEVVQLVRVGTADITMDPTPLLAVPNQATGSLGAQASFQSGASTNDVLLRWDVTRRKEKTFIGRNELVEQHVPLDSFVRGRYFFLPDTGLDPNTLQVFIEDPQGTYRSGPTDGSRLYRLAGFDDVVLDTTQGLVSLRNPVKGRVLVHYRKAGFEVGDPAIGVGGLPKDNGTVRDPSASTAFNHAVTYLGQPMSSRFVDLSAAGVGQCLLLWEPGDNSPFEIESSYAFQTKPPDDSSRISFSLVPL
ncbi:MAG TPA: hypothetical protein VFH83_01135, partial [Spirochaetia bacterium]|nr:hypothetical protein [Spirochaetia bacterium]